MSGIKIQSHVPIQPNRSNDDEQLKQAAKMYEGHFLNEMVKAMRGTISHSELTKPTMAEEIYTDKLFDNYVESWSDSGGIGLAEIIYQQIKDRFFPDQDMSPPQGPIPIHPETKIKVDETTPMGIPVVTPKSSFSPEMSYLFETEISGASGREVKAPWSGEVVQSFLNDDRHLFKIKHDNGMLSTLSFRGETSGLMLGDKVDAGQRLGFLSPDSTGLTWQLSS